MIEGDHFIMGIPDEGIRSSVDRALDRAFGTSIDYGVTGGSPFSNYASGYTPVIVQHHRGSPCVAGVFDPAQAGRADAGTGTGAARRGSDASGMGVGTWEGRRSAQKAGRYPRSWK